MTPGHTINIVPTAAHVEVRLGGRLLAITDRAVKLEETGLPARYYLPPDDVRMDLLRSTSSTPIVRSRVRRHISLSTSTERSITASCGATRRRRLRAPE
jgi:hypothetical protein